MGKISHASVGTSLTQSEFESSNAHIDSEGSVIEIVRTATYVVAASDAPAHVLAQADYVCDGTADDVQIQAAWDALPTAGGEVHLSAGTFNLAADIDLTKHWCNLSGCGMGTVLKAAVNSINLLHLYKTGDTVAYLHIHDLFLDGNSKTVTGLYVDGAVGCWFDHLHIKNCVGWGIDLEYNHSLFFSDCQINSNSDGIRVGSVGNRLNNVCFDRCLIENNNGIGVLLGNVHPITFRNCTIEANDKQGIKAETVANGELYSCLIQSCHFEDNNEDEAADVYDIHLIDCNHFTVERCWGGNNTENYLLYVESAVRDFESHNNHWFSTVLTGNGESIDTAALNKNSGSATVTSGNTTVVVTHGLASTPTRVFVSPTLLSLATKWWITTIGASSFTINVDADPGAGTATFHWRVQIGEG